VEGPREIPELKPTGLIGGNPEETGENSPGEKRVTKKTSGDRTRGRSVLKKKKVGVRTRGRVKMPAN